MDFISKHQPSFGLVVLCPAAVFGPLKHVAGRSLNDLNLSNGMFWKLFCSAGKEAKLSKQTVWSYVDVRVRGPNPVQGFHKFPFSSRALSKNYTVLDSIRTRISRPHTSSQPPVPSPLHSINVCVSSSPRDNSPTRHSAISCVPTCLRLRSEPRSSLKAT